MADSSSAPAFTSGTAPAPITSSTNASSKDGQGLLTLLEVVDRCDSFPRSNPVPAKIGQLELRYVDLRIGTEKIGQMHVSLLPFVKAYNGSQRPIFDIVEDEKGMATSCTFMPWLDDCQSRSEAIAGMLNEWRKDETNFPCLKGWRDEKYGIFSAQTGDIAVAIERSACGLFGVHAYGVHINGFVQKGTRPQDVDMWIARRSLTKPTYPGMLDNMVAGGLAYGHSPKYTVIKECMEEASIPKEIAETAYPTSTITYIKLLKDGQTQPETQIIYDLELPVDYNPKPCDSEVADFRRWTLDECLVAIRQGLFKPNCACVQLDFMIRRGYLTPENEPDYLELITRLHRTIGLPITKVWPTFQEK
ncbi:hypothetical protein DFQ27_006120 [Actinomortierella ambigua]|uniref:Nudix hydrolase domain-containing protein n=1 Tax=Actinomortierella ambigua TaxID=1343610 RepID=A0A9P6U0X2_9FUNG|nr:hypothetical protein DFQ27_006120 [Actinomortierella ambigua]